MPDTNPDQVVFQRDEEFANLYANNIQFEPSVWDLKMLFGQLDQSRKPAVVEQHTAITTSWPHAKIAAYYLLITVIGHQAVNGPIQILAPVMPIRPNPEEPSLDEAGKRAVTYMAWIYDQFFGQNPGVEVPSTEPVAVPSAITG